MLTCATLTVNGWGRLSRRGRAVPVLHQDGGGWLGGAVVMQRGRHLGGHASERGATHAAILVTPWSRRVGHKRSPGAASGCGHQTRPLSLRGLRWGGGISRLAIVGSWSGIRMLLEVLGIRWRRSRRGETGIWLWWWGRTQGSVIRGGCYIVL